MSDAGDIVIIRERIDRALLCRLVAEEATRARVRALVFALVGDGEAL